MSKSLWSLAALAACLASVTLTGCTEADEENGEPYVCVWAAEDPPPALSDLGLPPAATTDPFSGEPLQLKKLPEGWLVYSVGTNLVDDGGELDEFQDVGAGPIR